MSANRPPRCSKLERDARVEQLVAAIASGVGATAAAKLLCRSWGISSRRGCRRYLALAYATMRAARGDEAEGDLLAAIETRRSLFRLAVADGDFGAAARVQDGLEKLLGLDRRERADVPATTTFEILEIVVQALDDKDTAVRVLRAVSAKLAAGAGQLPAPAPLAPPQLNSWYHSHNRPGMPGFGDPNGAVNGSAPPD